MYYETAAKINIEEGLIRVAHLLNVIGKDSQDMFDRFSLSETDRKDIAKVLQVFETRITNMIYEWYIFNQRAQEPGESLDHNLIVINLLKN